MPETMKENGGQYKQVMEESEAFTVESWRQFETCPKELKLAIPLAPHK